MKKKVLVLLLACSCLLSACRAMEAPSSPVSATGTSVQSPAGTQASGKASVSNGEAASSDTSSGEEVQDAFAACTNYVDSKREEYLAYREQHPEFSAQDAITCVNIGLNRPFYTAVEEIQKPEDYLVLCNKYHVLPADYVPSDLTKLSAANAVSGRTVTLRKDAAVAFEELCNAARAEGYTIKGQSGYRSYSYQKTLYNNYVAADGQAAADTYSARPGYSEHQTGLAIDVRNADRIYTDFGQTKEYQWAKDNIYKYGFILHYLPEKQWITGYKTEEWHFRYVGREVAEQIQKSGLTFDEYCAVYLVNRPQEVAAVSGGDFASSEK